MDISLRAFRARCRPLLLGGLATALLGSGSLALAPKADATVTHPFAAKTAAPGRLKPLTQAP